MFGDKLGQETMRKTNTFRPSLYLHVSSVNYDGYPVMIDRISMLKYQRLYDSA